MEEPALAPRKALKVSTSSTAHRAAEALAAVQHGAASGGVGPEEPSAEGKGAEVATERAGEDKSMPREVVGLGARAPKASEARAVDAGATEGEMAEARAPSSVESEAVGTEAR